MYSLKDLNIVQDSFQKCPCDFFSYIIIDDFERFLLESYMNTLECSYKFLNIRSCEILIRILQEIFTM